MGILVWFPIIEKNLLRFSPRMRLIFTTTPFLFFFINSNRRRPDWTITNFLNIHWGRAKLGLNHDYYCHREKIFSSRMRLTIYLRLIFLEILIGPFWLVWNQDLNTQGEHSQLQYVLEMIWLWIPRTRLRFVSFNPCCVTWDWTRLRFVSFNPWCDLRVCGLARLFDFV